MPGTILKVSVLANGSVLLDGKSISLAELGEALDAAPKQDAAVWYYRENAATDAPPVAMQVMQLIADRRLSVRLSAKPDFSDAIGPDPASTLERMFNVVRERAAQRQLAIVRPDLRLVTMPALAKDAAPAAAVAAVERLLPSESPRNVAVVADTAWSAEQKPTVQTAAAAVPFFGLVMGLAAVGHAVWMFEGAGAPMLAAGCRDADLLIVDSARLGSFPKGWPALITPVMRTPFITVHDRQTFQLRRVAVSGNP